MHPDYATAGVERDYDDERSKAPVHEAVMRCERELEGMAKALAVLSDRLTAVVAPSTPSPAPDTVRAMPDDGGVPLARDLHSHADSIASLRGRVESMTQRLGV